MVTTILPNTKPQASTESHAKEAESGSLFLVSSKNTESSVIRIKRYLQQVLFRQCRSNLIRFPSVRALADSFRVSQQEIYGVLNEFHQMGFDYAVFQQRDAIIVWDKLALSSVYAKK